MFDWNTPRNAGAIDHLTTIDDIEQKRGLDFLLELPDDVENQIEGENNQEWARANLNY